MEQDDRGALPCRLARQLDSGSLDQMLRHAAFSTIRGMDVNESNFQSAVIERSHSVPVVVDFWAEWCGPCRQLGPVIERAVAARAGKVELAKLDVDSNPSLAQTYRIQGIPAVKAFRDGKVVSEFVGAQ